MDITSFMLGRIFNRLKERTMNTNDITKTAEVVDEENNYPAFGTVVKFTLVGEWQGRFALDWDFQIGKIILSDGKESFASMDQDVYFKFRNSDCELTAYVGHQVFEAPKNGAKAGLHSFSSPSKIPVLTLFSVSEFK